MCHGDVHKMSTFNDLCGGGLQFTLSYMSLCVWVCMHCNSDIANKHQKMAGYFSPMQPVNNNWTLDIFPQ